jgi:nitrogen fixation/metabolism regulation signal transduction histidine kinase
MRFLARENEPESQAFPVEPLIEEAYQEARKHQPGDKAQLQCDDGGKPIVITGDRAALKHALAEIMLNALQANPKEPKIGVRLHTSPNHAGQRELEIEVQDNGTGFTSETAQKVPSPFFTTRNVGLGLGLTVSRKIIETHHGKLEIVPPQAGQHGTVRILLPIDSSTTTGS